MTMRDKIAEIVWANRQTNDLDADYIADAIIKALPDHEAQQARITELEAALRSIEEFRVGPSGQTVAERVMRELATKALKEATND
jgi:hypothetical protein